TPKLAEHGARLAGRDDDGVRTDLRIHEYDGRVLSRKRGLASLRLLEDARALLFRGGGKSQRGTHGIVRVADTGLETTCRFERGLRPHGGRRHPARNDSSIASGELFLPECQRFFRRLRV